MSDTKHTAGPWQTKSDDDRITIIANVDGEIIDGIHHPSYDTVARCEDEYGGSLPNAETNAAFIVRACNVHGKLLAALKVMVQHHKTSPHIGLARAAIAKAEGRTP